MGIIRNQSGQVVAVDIAGITEVKGIKHDEGKLDWSLLPFAELEDVIRALMHGEKEYGTDNWKYVKPKKRYLKAAYRHMSRWMQGERFDIGVKGSGLPHLAHAICCLLFAMWHDTEDAKNDTTRS